MISRINLSGELSSRCQDCHRRSTLATSKLRSSRKQGTTSWSRLISWTLRSRDSSRRIKTWNSHRWSWTIHIQRLSRHILTLRQIHHQCGGRRERGLSSGRRSHRSVAGFELCRLLSETRWNRFLNSLLRNKGVLLRNISARLISQGKLSRLRRTSPKQISQWKNSSMNSTGRRRSTSDNTYEMTTLAHTTSSSTSGRRTLWNLQRAKRREQTSPKNSWSRIRSRINRLKKVNIMET